MVSKTVEVTGLHTIDSEEHVAITTTKGFRIIQKHDGQTVVNCEEIPGGLSHC
jgi:hypothetical protein